MANFRCILEASRPPLQAFASFSLSHPSLSSSSLFFKSVAELVSGLRRGSQSSSKIWSLLSLLNISSLGGSSPSVQSAGRVDDVKWLPPSLSASPPPPPPCLPMLWLFHDIYEEIGSFGPVIDCRFFIPSRGGGTEMASKTEEEGEQIVHRGVLVPEVLRNSRCVGSSHGWLAFINSHDCTLYLSSLALTAVSSYPPRVLDPSSSSSSTPPPSRVPIFTIQLPSITTLPHIHSIDIDEWPYVWPRSFVFACRKVPRFRYPDPASETFSVHPSGMSLNFVRKIILSAAPPSPYKSNSPPCTALAILGGGLRDIAFCQLGSSDSWILLNEPVDSGGYEDIMYSETHQQFYAFGYNLGLEAWDLRDPSSPKKTLTVTGSPPSHISKSIQLIRHCKLKYYLAESLGDILLVRRYVARHVNMKGEIVEDVKSKLPYLTVRFDVMKLNSTRNKYELLEDLGDRVLFVGLNHSVSISAAEFLHLRPNSIYFSDDNFDLMHKSVIRTHFLADYTVGIEWGAYGGHDSGIFDLKNERITQLRFDQRRIERENIAPPPVWAFPNPA